MDEDTIERAEAWCVRHGGRLLERLGFGIHGMVFSVESNAGFGVAAVKVLYAREPYWREKEAQRRLLEMGVQEIRGFEVPRLLDFDDELLAVKMSIVTAPYVLDLAGAYLDFAPQHSDEVWTDWERKNEEQFGADWPEAQLILDELHDLGIYMHDPSPSNIRFR